MTTSERPHLFILAVIVLGYWLIGALYAIQTPLWQAPDEPAHYNYIRQIADDGCCPVIEMGDWDSPYLEELKSTHFAPTLTANIASIEYEDHQPPLYYALGAIPYRLTGGSVIAVRLLSVMLGTGAVIGVYIVGRLLLPNRHGTALSAAALVAFIPQHGVILGSINNDALAELWVTLMLVLVTVYLRQPKTLTLPTWARRSYSVGVFIVAAALLLGANLPVSVGVWLALVFISLGVWMQSPKINTADAWHVLLGTLLGLAFITKTTAYFMAAVVPLAIIARPIVLAAQTPIAKGAGVALKVVGAISKIPMPNISRKNEANMPKKGLGRRFAWQMLKTAREVYAPALRRAYAAIVRGMGLVLAVALLIGGLWWGRNMLTYGGLDFMGLEAHDVVVVGQLRTVERIAEVGWDGYWRGVFTTTFNSFWGQLGWMALPLPNWAYSRIGFMLLGAVIGLVFDIVRMRLQSKRVPTTRQVITSALFGLTALLVLLQFAYYNFSFYQVQGRYLFNALIPFTLLIGAGLDVWGRLLAAWLQARGLAWGTYAVWLMPLFLAGTFGAFNLWLIRFVIPYLAP